MFERIKSSLELVKESFQVLNMDRELMIFPILSALVSGVVLVSFLLPLLAGLHGKSQGGFGYFIYYLMIFAYYLISYYLVIFFNVALVTCAHMRLNGKDPTLSDGFRNAFGKAWKILQWALVSATVGVFLRSLSDRSNIVGRILVAIIGIAWSLLTFFVIPVLAFENLGVLDSIKRSGQIFAKTWGENAVGQISMSAIFTVLGIPALVIIGAAILSHSFFAIMLGVSIALLYWILLGIVSSSLHSIFVAALYDYGVSGKVSQYFSPDTMKKAFAPRPSGVMSKMVRGIV